MMIVSMWTHLPPPPPHRPLPQHVGNIPDQQFAIFYPEMLRFLSCNITCSTKNVKHETWYMCYCKNIARWQWCPCFRPGVSYIKLTRSTASKRLSTLLGESSIDLKSQHKFSLNVCLCEKNVTFGVRIKSTKTRTLQAVQGPWGCRSQQQTSFEVQEGVVHTWTVSL